MACSSRRNAFWLWLSDSTEFCDEFVLANSHLPSEVLVTVSEVELSDLRQELILRLKKKIKHVIKRICKEIFMILLYVPTRTSNLNSLLKIIVFAIG